MKTYSRKSSRYLKKAFIASNFNEMCRLCLSEVDMVLTPIFQDSQMSYQEWIQYSVDVLVEEGDGLPPNICEDCLSMVEQTYLFKKKCKASDSKLREHLQLMDSTKSTLIETQFETNNHTSITTMPEKELESSQNVPEQETVDPGGFEVASPEEQTEKEVQDVEESVNIKNHKSKSAEKDVIRPINDDNIIINEVKRYVWKNESTGEKDVTVCEVVHYDIREEIEDSNDETESDLVTSAHILEEYSSNMKDSSEAPGLHLLQNADIKVDESYSQQQQKVFEVMEVGEKYEGKIQEICQLWDNDEEDGEEVEDEDEEELQEKEGLVVDVSWEDNGSQVSEKGNGVVELKLEENGVVKTHKVFTSQNCIQLINEPEEPDFICTMCSKSFKVRKDLRDHVAEVHKDANNTLCKLCMKNFTSVNSLKRHMLVHTGVKPYDCDICGRKFSQTSILKRHKFTHGKKKPFECNFCQKSYTQKMNLITHLRNHGVKTEMVSHGCKLCSKSFVHPSGLSRHLKQHKGVRFSCRQCNKSFSDSSALARHVKSTHS
ncbi:UNVERIFIED_CONTAM: hypothetical protein PYX00_002367 [Menopon gallinae]|uniref:Uncharacterized protein n=1 Tax=Menopon gallinae TaxID=328185 RepID=A0AAW2IH36_9NEOP